jgi:hypothetical protein
MAASMGLACAPAVPRPYALTPPFDFLASRKSALIHVRQPSPVVGDGRRQSSEQIAGISDETAAFLTLSSSRKRRSKKATGQQSFANTISAL